MSIPAPRFAMLAGLSGQASSEDRRELLRKVTEAMDNPVPGGRSVEELDSLLATVAADYSAQVRADLARLVANKDALFTCSAQLFARDEIEVARPVLQHARNLSDTTLLDVIAEKGQEHMMAVTQRPSISGVVSHALVERGDDHVVSSLLSNRGAMIEAETFEAVAVRAQASTMLQAPLVNRSDVPVGLLNELYTCVEKSLRQEILRKVGAVPPEEIERAFQKNRKVLSKVYGDTPLDFEASVKRIDQMARQKSLHPPALVTLLREGPGARTAFKLALARLTDVEFDLVQRVVEGKDLDTLALLCRGANFNRPLFVSLAIALDGNDRALGGAEEFGNLYEAVPVEAAQRAVRFWKVRKAA
ncbi:MAG: DUF2336 domain-containing protein [Alphaproteobacteria bacterium]|nr:DUF2336 domain-containing protein [Alphaproteobacteria bacterium]